MGIDDPRTPDKKQPAATTRPVAAEAPDSGVDDALGAKASPRSPRTSRAALESDKLQANLSAIATAQTGSLEAVGSAVGFASVSGDASLTASAAPIVYAKGDISVRQCYTSAVLAGGDMDITQAGAPLIVGKKLDVSQGGALVMLSGESMVSNGFVGDSAHAQGHRRRRLPRADRNQSGAHHRRCAARGVRPRGIGDGAGCAARHDMATADQRPATPQHRRTS